MRCSVIETHTHNANSHPVAQWWKRLTHGAAVARSDAAVAVVFFKAKYITILHPLPSPLPHIAGALAGTCMLTTINSGKPEAFETSSSRVAMRWSR
jgi:hypothetical protein